MLEVIAEVFQKDLAVLVSWMVMTPRHGFNAGQRQSRWYFTACRWSRAFCSAPDILQIAIPELLSQTGTGGRQFAQLLIRAHQEHHQNHFPELERAAEEIGQKQMPLSVAISY